MEIGTFIACTILYFLTGFDDRCRLSWQLQEIEKAQDGTYNLFYQTPEGGRKVRLT